MRVGIPAERKNNEFRVGMTPAGIRELVRDGHEVVVQRGAGRGSSIEDADYVAAGGQLAEDAASIWGSCELIVKVKEPIPEEYPLLRPGAVLFTYLHLAADAGATHALLESGMTSLAYETVELADGSLPLLAPMSEVAGRLAVQEGAHHLLSPLGGRGVLLGGVPGVEPGRVVIVGGGVAGTNAAEMAVGLRAEVTVLDIDQAVLHRLDREFAGRVHTVMSSAHDIERAVLGADLIIGTVLVAGARTPTLVPSDLVAQMRPGAVFVDVAIDQGGCFADSHPTTHDDPTFLVHGCLFYCVANMPGAVPTTSTRALTGATLPYIRRLAKHGWKAACAQDPALGAALTTHAGELFSAPVAAAHALPVATLPW